jgi:hypothetical protein
MPTLSAKASILADRPVSMQVWSSPIIISTVPVKSGRVSTIGRWSSPKGLGTGVRR